MTTTNHPTYWISIGRNVGAEPMSDYDWNHFRYTLAREAGKAGTIVASVRDGVSAWHGGEEDTFLLLVSIPSARKVSALKLSLARLARDYDQDAIGFVGGIGPTTVEASK